MDMKKKKLAKLLKAIQADVQSIKDIQQAPTPIRFDPNGITAKAKCKR